MKKHKRVCAYVDLDAVQWNLQQIHGATSDRTKIVAVIKANGYGHGAIPIARKTEKLDYVVDTGMARLPGIHITGLFTHFARADEFDSKPAEKQLHRYQQFADKLETAGISLPYRHCSNSAGIMNLPRSLSNKGYVLIRGESAPIVGRICMDQFMVDVSDIPDVQMEDEVTLIGRDGEKQITMEEMGDISGRFNYEFACNLTSRVPRVYINV